MQCHEDHETEDVFQLAGQLLGIGSSSNVGDILVRQRRFDLPSISSSKYELICDH